MIWRPEAPTRALLPWRFDAATGRWSRSRDEEARPSTPQDGLSLVTWNVWFGALEQAARADALLAEVQRQDPDLVCLQEVTAPFLERLLRLPWVRERYAVSDASGETVEPYGVLILSRLPVLALRQVQLPSTMGRTLLCATVPHRGRQVTLATVHLESMRTSGERRAEQLELILPLLEESGQDTVLCGDMNFAPTDTLEQSRLRPGWLDLWPRLNGLQDGYTSDTTINRMAAAHKGREKHARIDRVFLWTAAAGWRPQAMALLGTAPISASQPDVFPSDHLGLVARV